MSTDDYGLVGDLVVGVASVILGGLLLQTAGIPIGGGLLGSLVAAAVGSIAWWLAYAC